MKAKVLAFALLAAAAAPVSAGATVYHFQTALSGLNEVPVVVTPGSGFGNMFWDDVAHTATLDIVFQDLIGVTVASHTHSPTPGAPGPNFLVASTTPTYAGFPLGVSSGTYHVVLDLTSATSWNPAFVTAWGGVTQAEAALFSGLQAGQAYLNVHTDFRPGGEIRGTWALVPEPGVWTMLIAGFGAAGAMLRRRRMATA